VSPVTHFLAGWALANAAKLERRDRALVTLAGVAPDLDGLGIIAEVLTRDSARPLPWFSEYHHVLGHNIGFAAFVTILAAVLARDHWRTAVLVCVSFHLHLLCDLAGARGPDGEQWPIPYLSPFSSEWQLTWSGQWALNAWPNFVFTGLLIVLALWLAVKRGFSPVEMISSRCDTIVVEALRRRFGS